MDLNSFDSIKQQANDVISNGDTTNWDNFWNGAGQFLTGVGDFLFNTPQKVQNWFLNQSTNSANSQGKIAYTKSGVAYDETNPDSMVNALNTEYANKRDDTAYTRLIKQLKDNGINPALVLGNTSAMSSDSGFRSSYSMTTKDQVNSALKAGTILLLLMKLLK